MGRGKTLLFSLVATCVGLAVLEGAARVVQHFWPVPPASNGFVFRDVWTHDDDPLHTTDTELFWKPVPGRVVGEARINRDGCRGPEIPATKPPGVRRLVLAGDSVTFGWGVSESASFAGRLRQDLG